MSYYKANKIEVITLFHVTFKDFFVIHAIFSFPIRRALDSMLDGKNVRDSCRVH